jgi:dihydrofolate reductase
MSGIVAIEHLTLDGVMQGPARPDEDRRDGFKDGGWGAERASDPAIQKMIGARMGSAWSLLVGRITYEDLYGHWTNQPPNPMSDALNRVEKFVASTTLAEPLPWQNSTLLKGAVPAAVADLKRNHDKTLVIFGSGALVQSLMRHDLVDEFVLQVHPLVLGRGRHLFPDGVAPAKFDLIEATTTATGIFVGIWKPLTE